MLSLALLFGILVLSTAQATPAFALAGDARDVGVEVGDTWSYDYSTDIDLGNPTYEQTEFIEPWDTIFGPIVMMVDINYTTYWEVGLEPDIVYATLDFQIGDLSSTSADAVEVRYVYADIYNRTYVGGEYVADTHFAALYFAEDSPAGIILDSYDSFSLTFDYLSWWLYWLEEQEWDAYIEFRVGLKAYNTADAQYGGWYSAPFDEERPDIDIYPNGWHSKSGYFDYTLTGIDGDLYTASQHVYIETSAGIVTNDYERIETCDVTRWIVGSIFAGTARFDGETIVELNGLLVPVHYCMYEIGSAQYYTSYSDKSGVRVEHTCTHESGQYSLILSSASFEYACTEADLSMTISKLNYAVDNGSSFDVDCIVLNDGDLAGDFLLELVGTGFSGSYSGTAESGQTEVTMTIAVGADLDAGTYNVNVRLVYDGTPVDNKDIVVQVNVATTTTDGNLTTDGVDILIVLAVGGIILAIVVIVVLSKRKKH
jgi:hypothetical protein